MKKLILLLLPLSIFTSAIAQTVVIPDVWINEIHYNNIGTDTLDGFEIAGPANTNLACYMVYIYNGGTGQAYLIDTLSGTLSNQQGGYGTIWYGLPQGSIQNTVNIGFALVYAPQATACGFNNVDTVLLFLSCGGQFAALGGRAQGLGTTDIGVSEDGTTPVGSSLQLQNSGNKYIDFYWQSPLPSTYNLPNSNQTLADPIVQFLLASDSVSEGVGLYGVSVSITNPTINPTSVDINVLPGGTATFGTNFTYSPVTVIFPGGSSFGQIVNITVIDDSTWNGDKYFTFKLNYQTNGAVPGSYSTLVFTMGEDDSLQIKMQGTVDSVNKDTGIVYIAVDLNLLSETTTSVQLNVVPGSNTTAVQGVDYSFNDTTISWPAGTRGTILVPVTVINNSVLEQDKQVQFALANPTGGGLIIDTNFILVIHEFDTVTHAYIEFLTPYDSLPVPSEAFYLPVVVKVNNPGTLPVTFSTVKNLAASTAIYGVNADYVCDDQTFINYPGITYDTLLLIVFPNNLVEPTKTVVFHFMNVGVNGAVLADSVHTVYILNPSIFTVSFLGAAYSYPKDTGLIEIKLTTNYFSPVPTSVNVTQAPGSAIYGVDYLFNDTIVTFPAYSVDTQGVWVTIINNNTYQPNKQINFNLSNPTNGAALGIIGYTVTIINNDSLASGIIETGADNFRVFPNPAFNQLNIACDEDGANAEIRDVLGNFVLAIPAIKKGKNEIDISSLAAGIYFMRIYTADKTSIVRFTRCK